MFFNSRSLLAAALVVVGALEASAQALEFKPILDLKDYTVGPDSMKRDSTRPPLELVPISDPGFLTHGRALRRAVTGKEAFDVRSAETFYWGAYVGDNIYIANFTLSAPDDDELIMPLERFSKQLKSLKCGTPGQPIVMEFSDQESFEYALSAWDWVNKEDVNKFTLVTEPDQCYKGDNRSPYLVKTITFDKENFTANVQAEEQEWSKVARNFRLNLGHQPVPPATANVTHPHLQRREAGKEFDIAHSFNGNLFNFDVQSPTTAGMAMNADAEITTAGRILSDFDIVMESVTDIIDKIPNPDIKLPDIKLPDLNPFDKRAAGLKREVGLPKDVKLTITPQDVTASFLLKLHADGTLGKPLDWSMSPAIDIPIYGFKVGGIIEIGPFLTMSAHYGSTALEGTGDLKMGANGTLDNSAKLSVQMTDVTKNSFENWTPKITGIEPTFSAEFTGNMKAWAELALVIKAEVMGKWGYQAGFEAQLPYFQADLVGTKEPTGVCNSTKTVGIDLKASVGIDLSLQAGSVKGAAAASQSLFTTQWPLYTTCLAIGADNAKTATDATATGTDTVEPTGTEAIPTGTDATLTGTDAEDTGPIETGMPTETGELPPDTTADPTAGDDGEIGAKSTAYETVYVTEGATMTGDVPTETGLPDDTKTDLPEDSTATDSPEGATMTEDPTMSETGVPEEASSTAYETVYVTEGANATMTGSLPEETSLDATATDEIAPEETGLDATATDESLSEETGLAEESEVGVANVESTKAGMPTKTVAGITGPGTGSAVPATTRSTLMTMVSIAPTKPVPSKTHGQDLQVPTPSAVRRRWL